MIQIFLNLQIYKISKYKQYQSFGNIIVQANKINRRITKFKRLSMQSELKSSINIYRSKSQDKPKYLRKIPDPYLNLVHRSREYQRIQNSIKIYQNKKNLLKRKCQIKKLKVINIQQVSQIHNRQKSEQGSSAILLNSPNSIRFKNKTLHTLQRQKTLNHQSRIINNFQNLNRLSLNQSSVTQKQKLENHILQIVKQRKERKQLNQKVMKQNCLQSLRQKILKKKTILKFQESLHKKKENIIKSYIEKVQASQQKILRELRPLQNCKNKQIESIMKAKCKISDQILFLKQKNKSLNRQFAKISNLKNQAMVQHVMRSSRISIR